VVEFILLEVVKPVRYGDRHYSPGERVLVDAEMAKRIIEAGKAIVVESEDQVS
jgi:hypothetical protein